MTDNSPSQQSRAEEIIRHVLAAKGGVWDAYDQGRWSHAVGEARNKNPHVIPSIPDCPHVNVHKWYSGWDDEEQLMTKEAA